MSHKIIAGLVRFTQFFVCKIESNTRVGTPYNLLPRKVVGDRARSIDYLQKTYFWAILRWKTEDIIRFSFSVSCFFLCKLCIRLRKLVLSLKRPIFDFQTSGITYLIFLKTCFWKGNEWVFHPQVITFWGRVGLSVVAKRVSGLIVMVNAARMRKNNTSLSTLKQSRSICMEQS